MNEYHVDLDSCYPEVKKLITVTAEQLNDLTLFIIRMNWSNLERSQIAVISLRVISQNCLDLTWNSCQMVCEFGRVV